MAYNGSIVGSPSLSSTESSFSTSNNAANFGDCGSNFSDSNYISLPSGWGDIASGGALTLRARLRLPSGSSSGIYVAVSNGAGTYSNVWIGVENSVPTFSFCGTDLLASSGVVNIADGAWHTVTGTVTNNAMTIYVDSGTAGGTATCAQSGAAIASAAGMIGRFSVLSGYSWPGQVDEVALFSAVVTSYTTATTPITGTASNLHALYHLDNTAADSAGVTLTVAASPGAITTTQTAVITVSTSDGSNPSGVTLSVTSGTGSLSALSSFSGGSATATYTPSGTTTAVIGASSTGYNSGSVTVTVTTGAAIAPTDSGLLYSPYNWYVQTGSAKTVNAGAYIRTILNSTATCVIGLTIGTATPYSQLKARIDQGPWQQYTPTASGAQTWTLTLPTPTTSGQHLLEVVVKSTTETQDRWNTQTTAVTVTGLTLDSGATVSAPTRRLYTVLIYGDSITEGVRVNGYSGITNDTDRNDVTAGYSWELGRLLDAEVGIVGFGGSGLTVAGSGNVPALSTSYASLWSGQARSFAVVPDLVIYNEGTNESAATLSAMTTALQTVINGIGYTGTANTHAGLNATRHLVLRPFGGAQASNLQTIATGYGRATVAYGDTTGLWSTSESSDSLHPYAFSHLGKLAPAVAALALPLLASASSATTGVRRVSLSGGVSN